MAVSGIRSSLRRCGWCLVLLVVLLPPTAPVRATDDVVPQAPSRDDFCNKPSVSAECRLVAPANQSCYPPSCSKGCTIDRVETPEAAAQLEAPSWGEPACPLDLIKCTGNSANQGCCGAIQTAMAGGNDYALGCVYKRLKEVGADKCKMMKCCYCSKWCQNCGGRLCPEGVEGAYAY